MAEAWGSLPDLISRADALDDEANDLAQDVMELFGCDTEASRTAVGVRASIAVLLSVLREAAAVRGDQP